LDLDKISELKHIYSICEGGKGYASIDQIKECRHPCWIFNDVFIVTGNFKQLTFAPEQLMKIFTCIKEKNKNIVTSESFSSLMSRLERVY